MRPDRSVIRKCVTAARSADRSRTAILRRIFPPCCIALRATLVAQGPNGTREIGVDDFFSGFLETALEPDELLTEIRVPKAGGAGWSFQKFNRRAQDWAIVGVACVRNGSTGIGLVNMGSTPLRGVRRRERASSGASIEDAAAVADQGTDPPSDLNATPEYRRHLARVLVRRALDQAAG